jgi:hypothetical protein
MGCVPVEIGSQKIVYVLERIHEMDDFLLGFTGF